jgi:hypothetical protein
MNFALNTQIDLVTTSALPFKGNATIYNSLLKDIDLNVEIPPAVGKGQIMDLVGKIFTQPNYETIKNEISQIILKVSPSKGTTILKLIKLITLFRPENESLISPLYTKLSHELDPESLESLLAQVSNLEDQVKIVEDKINPMKLLESVQGMIVIKGGIKNKVGRKNKVTRKNKVSSKKNKVGRKNKRRRTHKK